MMWKNAENVEKDLPPNPQVLYGWGKQAGSCPKCGLEDFGKSTVDMHIKRDHPKTPQGTYSCWICPYTFRKHGQFVKHHREGHGGEKMACWVCGEKNWTSTAMVYEHIKKDHPGYRKGIAREYFATLKKKTKTNRGVPSVSSQTTSSSFFDSFSDNTSMDSYYSEYSTDMDEDGAPIFSSDLSTDYKETPRDKLEEDKFLDEDGAPLIDSLPFLQGQQDLNSTSKEKDNAVTMKSVVAQSPPLLFVSSNPMTVSPVVDDSFSGNSWVDNTKESNAVTIRKVVALSPPRIIFSSNPITDSSVVEDSFSEENVVDNRGTPNCEVLENIDSILGI